MDDDLKVILQDILDSEDNAGCSEDLTVVSSGPIERLREYLKHYDLGGGF